MRGQLEVFSLTPIFPNDKKTKDEKFTVFDIESMNWIDFLCVGYYDGEHFWWWKSMNEFIDTVRDEKVKVCYAHFGGKFDFMFVFQSMVPRRDIRIEKMIPRGSGLLCFDAVFMDHRGKEIHKCSFRDSSALLPFGLESLTNSFGVEHKKQKWDHEKTTGVTNELVEYLMDDCRGLYEVLDKFYNWDLIKASGPASTMAGQAMKVFRTFLHRPIKSLKNHNDAFVRSSYFGGRTEIFKPLFLGNKNQKLYCYDVNSLYPYIMRECEFPTNFRSTTFDYLPDEMGFYEAVIDVPKNMYIPPLPTIHKVNKTPKLIFPTGRIRGVWSTVEIEYAKSLGCKVVSTGCGMLFDNGGYIFKDYINTLYSMRMKAKEENDGVTDTLTKLLMNSLYGRFGLNLDRENLVFDNGEPDLEFHREIALDPKCIIRLMKKPIKLKSFTNVAISAWVTSNSRIHMHKYFMSNPGAMYYTDTDSLFTTDSFDSGKLLGELKLEYECEQACFLLPKTYIAQSSDDCFIGYDKKGEKIPTNKKITMKGFDRKKISNFKMEDFMDALEGDLKRLRVVHDPKFATFKSAIRQDTFLAMLPESSKQIRSMYDKRSIIKTGQNQYDTKPLDIQQE